jgi:type VI secretion system protein VasJ
LPPETVEVLKSGIDRMIRLFDEKVPESPSLMSLKRFFHSLPSADEKPPEPAKPPSENAPAVSPAAAQIPPPKPAPSPPEPAVSPVIDTLQDAEKTVREALTLIRKAAGCFREKDLMNPIGYRLNRIAAWTNIQFLPPVADGKKTRLPPPDPHLSSNLRIFRENGKYESLIALAENEQSRYIFWLDLSRYVSEALASMGDRYKGASDAVNLETALFVQRLKGLEEMAFSDGMPFADADTLKWLDGLAVGTSASFAPAPPAVPAGEVPESQGDMARKVAEAHLLLKKNEIYQAISMIQDELRRSGSCREKMKWRLALVQLLLASKKGPIALAHAETILKDIETYRLEQWDPEVAAQGLKMAWMVMTHQPEAELKEKAWNILCRLAALDPADASRLSK